MGVVLKSILALGVAGVLVGTPTPAATPQKTMTPAVKAKAPVKPVLPPNPKKLAPPPGFPLPPEVAAELNAGAQALSREIDALRGRLKDQPQRLALLPDVEIFRDAVRRALEDDIFYSVGQHATARALLKQGLERASQLQRGEAPWNTATGLVVRGYVSRLDGSVQPYGLVVPPEYQPGYKPMRLDFWFHGRGETVNELAFLEQRQKTPGEFTPSGALVLHPYGRYCNAAKFAGEVDAFEALENVRQHYPVDERRIVIRGFSMGGASAWHFGVHYASRWVAVNPGAGFVDVQNFLKLADKLDTVPWYEQKLWNLYDPLSCPINLLNTTLIAYSGEVDGQKAAADLMEQALAKEGVKMTHIIGPNTGHKYEPGAKQQVMALVDAAAHRGLEPQPSRMRFVTHSLKYNRMGWLEITALEQHWEKAEVEAEVTPKQQVLIKTKNVAALHLFLSGYHYTVNIDGQFPPKPLVHLAASGHALVARKQDGQWLLDYAADKTPGLAKRHDLQGPIDDAFMDSFLMVRPTGQPMNPALGQWTQTEMNEALFQWRRQLRGRARVKADTEVVEADFKAYHLVLWGDPSSNRLLARMAGQLPIRWTARGIMVQGQTFEASRHALAMIYPNPLNPERYVVLNSGPTFVQGSTSNNALQTPKLPDWAILELAVPVAERLGGKGVAAADFFGEKWELKPRLPAP